MSSIETTMNIINKMSKTRPMKRIAAEEPFISWRSSKSAFNGYQLSALVTSFVCAIISF